MFQKEKDAISAEDVPELLQLWKIYFGTSLNIRKGTTMVMMIKWSSVLFPIIIFVVLTISAYSEEPAQDPSDAFIKKQVESFFFNIFSRELGYTLIGSKPISQDEFVGKYYRKIEFFQDVDKRVFSELQKVFAGSSRFVLKVFFSGPYPIIELVHKKAVRDLVRRNATLQEFIKKEFTSDEDFYSQIENPHQTIFKTLRNNDRVLGLLFGYDETNIEYYTRRNRVGLYLQKYPFVRYHALPGGRYSDNPYIFQNPYLYYDRLNPKQNFDSLESEWQWIKDIAWDIDEESEPIPPFFISLPCYICRHGGGSELVREKFKQDRGKIAELFYHKSFQEAVRTIALQK